MRQVLLRLAAVLPVVTLTAHSSTGATEQDTGRLYRLPSVSVVALRVPPLLDIPYALSLPDTASAAFRRSYGIEELLSFVPGVFVQSRSGSSDLRIVIRGFGARGAGDRSNNGTTRGIRIVLDGAPLTEPDGRTTLDLLEPAALSSGAILRSNATLLWGNASGGILAFRTLPWQPHQRFALAVSSGSFGYRKLFLQLLPLESWGAFQAVLAYTASRGWRHHSDAERFWIGLGLSSPLDSSTLLEWSLTATRNRFAVPGPLDWDTFVQNPEAANPTYLSQHARRENTLALLSATLRTLTAKGQLLQLTLFAQPKFLIRSERGTYREFSRVHTGASALFANRWDSAPLQLELTLGGDGALQDGPALFYRLTPSGGRDSILLQNKREAGLSAGGFLRLTAHVGDATFWAGARLEWLQYRLIDALRPSLSAVHSFRQLLPSFGFSYRFSEAHSLYAHLSSGWEVPAYNEIDPPPTQGGQGINPELQAMESWTLELGSRHRFTVAGGILRSIEAELALFGIDSRNELVPYGGGRFYVNAARSRRAGLELRWSATFAGGWSLQQALTLASMRYAVYRIDSSYFGSAGGADFSGNALPGIPAVLSSLRLQYSPSWIPLVTELEFHFVGRTYADDANSVRVPEYALWNLALHWNSPWRVFGGELIPWLSVQNLANRRYVGSVYLNPDRDAQGRALFAEPGLPRSLGAGILLRRGQ